MTSTDRYTSHHHINLLTAALSESGISRVVVCPGSRNAPIVHNLQVSGRFCLYPVTDERSATFVAVGLLLRGEAGVAICVTSGSALLNTLPAVAEAAMRHLPLLVISADRPPKFHGILDGQTLPQQGTLYPYAQTWQIPEVSKADDRACCRLLCDAMQAYRNALCPIHLNVPISEPLFEFSEERLPDICLHSAKSKSEERDTLPERWKDILRAARLPTLVIGQMDEDIASWIAPLRQSHRMLVYAECLSQCRDSRTALWLDEHEEVVPDVVVHLGGCFVNKAFKLRLRESEKLQVLRVDLLSDETVVTGGASCPDTFFKAPDGYRVRSFRNVLGELSSLLPENAAVRAVHESLSPSPPKSLPVEALFVGNSRTVRVVNRRWPVVDFPIYGNRGTNGIEGSLSVAAGYSLEASGLVLCILGDLSFFYDANALWNVRLGGRLRILLLNNGRGDIFRLLPGLTRSPALSDFVAAEHPFTAKGIAESYRCTYHSAAAATMEEAIDDYTDVLLDIRSERPVLFEVFIP